MRSILKFCYKFLPLFLGVVCIFLLVVALVPGQLEYASHTIELLRNFSGVLNLLLFGISFAGILTLISLTIYDLRKIRSNRKNSLKLPPAPAITSLSILACTWLLIQIHLPARLWFYTSSDRFDRALVQPQTLEDRNCQDTNNGCLW
jgi:formate hydrogenlyase subunit 3/multisubunit Na+/H+ antiporter MnhD subunit